MAPTVLGHYKLEGQIGSGGMGRVFRARDTRLGRDVAIKLLPPGMMQPHMLERMHREARMLAALDHPNIARVYGLEEADDRSFIVMELVEGETLAERLRGGPLPIALGLEVLRGVCAALETAHARGIIHRDLKPANIMVAGTDVKLLDFGLARSDRVVAPTHVESGTATKELEITAEGKVVGTPGYMSPEQLLGETVDRRTDIWALGCLMFEVLTGDRAFAGRRPSLIAAAVLGGELDSAKMDTLPPRISDVIGRCLRTDSAERFRDVVDVRLLLESEIAESSKPWLDQRADETTRKLPAWPTLVTGAVAVVAVVWALVTGVGAPSRDSVGPQQFDLELPEDTSLRTAFDFPPSLALSHDASAVAYVAERGGRTFVHSRDFATGVVRELEGTEGASAPFFSPDGQWVAYFAQGELRRIPASGGAPTTIATAPSGRGGAWLADDTIIFAGDAFDGLMAISATGGVPVAFTTVRSERGEQAHFAPRPTPDDTGIVFTVWKGGLHRYSDIAFQGFDSDTHVIVQSGGSHGRLLENGDLIYSRDGALLKTTINLGLNAAQTPPRIVLDGLAVTPDLGAPLFDVGPQGTLVYARAPTVRPAPGRMVLLSDTGQELDTILSGRNYAGLRFSTRGDRVAYHYPDESYDIWTYDLTRGSTTRVTTSQGWDGFPVWSPGGDELVFASARNGSFNLFRTQAGGGAPATSLLTTGSGRWPTSWASGGSRLLYYELSPETGLDIWQLDPHLPGSEIPWLATSFNEAWGRFSPDGKWVAFGSDESGSWQIYVAPSDRAGPRLQLSADGGLRPVWDPAGDRVFYANGDAIEVVGIEVRQGELQLLPPRVAFERSPGVVYDVDPASGSLLAVTQPVVPRVHALRIILGWNRILGNPFP
jgi:serine/threonine protein kinase/Tol biopolymer transport system component